MYRNLPSGLWHSTSFQRAKAQLTEPLAVGFDGMRPNRTLAPSTAWIPMVVQLNSPLLQRAEFPVQAHHSPGSEGLPRVEGRVQLVTAPHRSFFTSVMAEAFRLAGQGMGVLVVQFLKGGVHQGGDRPMNFCRSLDWFRCNLPFCITEAQLQHTDRLPQAQASVQALWQRTQQRIAQGQDNLVVLDELSLAVHWGLIAEGEVLQLLANRPIHMDVVLTGPHMPESLLNQADQITELRRPHL